MKIHNNQGLRKSLNLTFKQGTIQDYAIKKKNIRIKSKNTRRARQMWKQIFIMLTYANMNMKKNDKAMD